MKIRAILTSALAAVSAAAILTAGVSAYDLDKDLGTFWSASVTVPSSEFEGITTDSQITVTFTTDDSLADVDGHSYWVIKPMVNDAGWPLISGISEMPASEDGSAYVVEPGDTSVTFTIPADFIEPVQIAGVAFMGHGIKLETLTVNNDAPADVVDTPADDASPAAETPASAKGNPDTGVEGAFGAAALAAVSAAAVVLSKKRK